ncbi:MAG: TIGR03936 family radical SAM-associated protein [Anaerolineales bacterium]|nr:TIGR03936 family radical SAM-associated protein [Anaerolineales bacterium]
MQATYVQRLRITFSKTGPTRFIGHLDVARTWERALNRAKLPVTYSQGFNRRPKIQFATATPLGTTSSCELLDVWFDERLDPAEAQAKMMSRMAPGIAVVSVAEVPISGSALQVLTRETTYEATIAADLISYDQLSERIEAMLAAEALPRERYVKRKRKQYDLRPLIIDLTAEPSIEEEEASQLTMKLVLEPSKTGRPDEVLAEIGVDPLDVRVHRTEMVLAEEE